MPLPTQLLPTGCGAKLGPDVEGAVGGAPAPDAERELREVCAEAQAARVKSQQPFELVYKLAEGRDGRDGYFRLVSGTGDRHGLQ